MAKGNLTMDITIIELDKLQDLVERMEKALEKFDADMVKKVVDLKEINKCHITE